MAESMETDRDILPLDYYKLLEDNQSSRKSVLVIMQDRTTQYGTADYQLLESLWRDKLKCEVVPIFNPRRRELEQKLNDIVFDINSQPEKHDYFGLTFVGHGGCKYLDRNGERYYHEYLKLSDVNMSLQEIQTKFYTSNCPGLAGKVKKFYIAACRGSGDEQPSLTMSAAEQIDGDEDHIVTFYGAKKQKKCLYDVDRGSYFIQALCRVFGREYQQLHLGEMATLINQEITNFLPSGFVQTAEYEHSMKKCFKFTGPRFPYTQLPVYRGPLPIQVAPSVSDQESLNKLPEQALSAKTHGQALSAKTPEQALSAKTHGQELYDAAMEGDEHTVRTLLNDHNINVNYQNSDYGNYTPLMAACYYGNQDVVTSLLNCKEINSDITNEFGETALMLACSWGHTTIVAELLSNGAAVNLVDEDGDTALSLADNDVIKLLLEENGATN